MKRSSPFLFVALLVVACARSEPEATSAPAAASSAPPPPAAAPATPGAELPKSTEPPADTLDAEGTLRELLLAEKQLGEAVALAAPDCTTARGLRDRICELATRLCLISSPSPDLDLKAKCVDGKARCERAREKVGERCP